MNAVTMTTAPTIGRAKQFFSGIGLLFKGLSSYGRRPGLVLLGIVPALITSALYVAAFGALIWFIDDLAAVITPFADHWSEGMRDTVRVIAGITLLGVGGLLGVVTFVAVTLVIGDPFYEMISERVDDQFGGVPSEVDVPWWRSLARSLVDSSRLVAVSALVGIPLFVAGFIPVVGQFVVPVIGAVVGGWFLVLELVGAPFYRRGLRLPDRRRALKTIRPTALGFGVAAFVVFLIPLGAVLFMPAAVAGATLLARQSLGEPIEER